MKLKSIQDSVIQFHIQCDIYSGTRSKYKQKKPFDSHQYSEIVVEIQTHIKIVKLDTNSISTQL